MINKIMKMLDIPFDEEEYEKNVIQKSDAIRDCLCKNKNISGAFNELSETDQQNVVDAFNKMQGVFDGVFGVKMRPYTADDFKGATVNVHTTSTGDDARHSSGCDCEKKDFKCKTEKKAETGTICEDLLDELQDNREFETAAKDIAKKVVAILKDKKNKKYTLVPGTGSYSPHVKLNVKMCEVEWTSGEIPEVCKNQENWTDGPFESIIIDEIKKATGSPNVYITFDKSGILNVIIILKKKKS